MKLRHSMSISRHSAQGFTLIELMIALVLGLLVVGATATIFISNKQTFGASENLGRVQENARIAFEMIARDIRPAGGNPCGLKPGMVPNPTPGGAADAVISNGVDTTKGGLTTLGWAIDISNPIRAYGEKDAIEGITFGDTAAKGAGGVRVNDTEAFSVVSATDGQANIDDNIDQSANYKFADKEVNAITDGQIVMVCDLKWGWVFQAHRKSNDSSVVVHDTGNNVVPGNVDKNRTLFGSKSAYTFTAPSQIAALTAAAWYLGCNGRADCTTPAGRSLYRAALASTKTGATLNKSEIVDGVESFKLLYLESGKTGFESKSASTKEASIVAIQAEVKLVAPEKVSSTGSAKETLSRTYVFTTTIRSRM